MQNILITGGAGNVGSALANALLKTKKYHLAVIDNLSTGQLSNLSTCIKKINFFRLDSLGNIVCGRR